MHPPPSPYPPGLCPLQMGFNARQPIILCASGLCHRQLGSEHAQACSAATGAAHKAGALLCESWTSLVFQARLAAQGIPRGNVLHWCFLYLALPCPVHSPARPSPLALPFVLPCCPRSIYRCRLALPSFDLALPCPVSCPQHVLYSALCPALLPKEYLGVMPAPASSTKTEHTEQQGCGCQIFRIPCNGTLKT